MSGDPGSPAIRVLGLRKRFGPVRAVEDLSLETPPGSRCVGVLGRNGAGKTTLLRMLVGLLEPDAGQIEVGARGARWPYAGPKVATYIAEQSSLLTTITGRQHLRLYEDLNRLAGISVDTALRDKLIDRLELGPHLDKLIWRMSKGNRRKVEVVAAIASDVPLVFADELTEGLDIPSRIALESTIRELAGIRHFVLSSHDLSFISSTVDFVFIVDHGRCVDSFAVSADSPLMKDRVVRAFESLPEPEAGERSGVAR